MINKIVFAFKEILLFEKEIEKTKKLLWEKEDFVIKKIHDFLKNNNDSEFLSV